MAPVKITDDYYGILGVSQAASGKDIEQAYKGLAIKYHPDKNVGRETEFTAIFQKIAAAYETLSDTDKRRKYDLVHASLPRPASSPRQEAKATEETQMHAVALRLSQRKATLETLRARYTLLKTDLEPRIASLEESLKHLRFIQQCEAAQKAQDESWSTIFFSLVYTKAQVSEEEQARRDEERRLRQLDLLLKHKLWTQAKVSLQNNETSFTQASTNIRPANIADQREIDILRRRILTRYALIIELARLEMTHRARWRAMSEQERREVFELSKAHERQRMELSVAHQAQREPLSKDRLKMKSDELAQYIAARARIGLQQRSAQANGFQWSPRYEYDYA